MYISYCYTWHFEAIEDSELRTRQTRTVATWNIIQVAPASPKLSHAKQPARLRNATYESDYILRWLLIFILHLTSPRFTSFRFSDQPFDRRLITSDCMRARSHTYEQIYYIPDVPYNKNFAGNFRISLNRSSTIWRMINDSVIFLQAIENVWRET